MATCNCSAFFSFTTICCVETMVAHRLPQRQDYTKNKPSRSGSENQTLLSLHPLVPGLAPIPHPTPWAAKAECRGYGVRQVTENPRKSLVLHDSKLLENRAVYYDCRTNSFCIWLSRFGAVGAALLEWSVSPAKLGLIKNVCMVYIAQYVMQLERRCRRNAQTDWWKS